MPTLKTIEKDRFYMFPKSGTRMKRTPISRALLIISFGVRSKGVLAPHSPHWPPSETDFPLIELSFIHLSKSPVQDPSSRFPSGANMESHAVSRAFSTYPPKSPVKKSPWKFPLTGLPQWKTLCFERAHSSISQSSQWNTPIIINLSLKIPGKLTPLHVPRTGTLRREMLHLQNQWFIHSFITVRFPFKEAPHHKIWENTRSRSTEPHADWRNIYNVVGHFSASASFVTLLSISQGHAAFSTIPSTLAWVEQSALRQRVSVIVIRLSRPHVLPPTTWHRVK